MSGDMAADEIEARLDELADEKEQARELGESFGDVDDTLADIRDHPLVDDETAAQVALLKDMARHIRQWDLDEHERIHYEREHLRRQRELKRAEGDGERV
jgi:predicted trehalose synthase